MRIVELADPDAPAVELVYNDILLPSFPDDELVPLSVLRALVGAGLGLVWAAHDDAGDVVAVAIGEWDAELRVVLLSWLAVREGRRGGGVGGPLLDTALTEWRRRYDPCLVLAEVADPRHHPVSTAHGDPVARLNFYQRRGARILDMPYFQPALGPDKARVDHMLLIVLHADPAFAGSDADTIDATVLRRYLEKYQLECEGVVDTGPDSAPMWRALDRPNGVPLSQVSGVTG